MKLETQTEQMISETAVVCGQSKYIGIHALAQTVNALAAAGAVCGGVSVRILIPPYIYKSRVHAIEKLIKEACKEQKVELLEMNSEQNPAVNLPMVIATGIAHAPKEEPWNLDPARASKDIVLTGWAGMDGMLRIAEERERELKTRFAPAFLKQIFSYRQQIFALREIDVAKARGVSVVRQITDGGILAALWNLAKELDVGLELDMKRFSILQETIEVCEHFRLNPYQLISTGSYLMVTDDGEVLADALTKMEIPASVIGRTVNNNDKIIHNGEEIRYIDRPAPDELLRLFDGGKNNGNRTDKETDTSVSGET
ncbi:MAG: AIR synthase-related protein [Dorea sp.]